jgi:hypothetical protein
MDLDEALDIRSGGMPRGAAVLVTDEVDASGGWLISHLLRRALVSAAAGSDDADASRRAQAGSASASRPPGRVCLIAAEQPASHYTRTLAKLGRDARADLASGRLVVVDLLSPSPFDAIAAADAGEDEEEPGFQNSEIDRDLAPARALFQTIARALDALPPKLGSAFVNAETGTETETETEDGDDARFVAVFDDVHAALESVRVPARSMSAAVDGLTRSLIALTETAVVVGAHLDAAGVSASAPGGWLFALGAVADARLDVAALKTGAARDVHGRVRVTHRTGRFVRVRSSENGSSGAFGRGEKDTTIRKRASAKFGLAETGARATRET